MPNTNSIASSVDIKSLRRSPRFLTSTTKKSLRFLHKNGISPPTPPELRRVQPATRQVHSSHACLRSTHNVSPKTPKSVRVNTPKKPSKTNVVSSKKKDSNSGSKNSSTIENGVEGFQTPRRSSRLSCLLEGKNAKVSKSSVTLNTPKKLSKPNAVSSKRDDSNSGTDKLSAFENRVEGMQTPRRSSRLSYALMIDNALDGKNAKLSKSSVTLNTPKKLSKPNAVSSKRDDSNSGTDKLSAFENRVEGMQTPRRSSRLSYALMIDNALEGKNAKLSKSLLTLNTPKKPSKPNAVFSKKEDSNSGLKKSSTFGNGVEGLQTPRRSSRLSHVLTIDCALEGKNAKLAKSLVTLNTPKKPCKPNVVLSKKENSNLGSKRSSTFENGVEGIQTPRRSSRLSYAPMIDNTLEGKNTKLSKSSITLKNPIPKVRRPPRLSNGVGGLQSIGKSERDLNKKTGLLHVHNVVMKKSSHGENVVERKRRKGNSADHEGTATKGDVEIEKKSVANRKRKREDCVVGIRKGWTKEQEAALQRAYYAAKPTPQFWKKVSKLVSGKSAQECFDKVHFDHLTPPPPRPRSRTQNTKSSQIDLLSLSESKLLNLDGAVSRKPSRRKSHNAQKTVRYLLEKNFHGALNCEADLFSKLEPNINLSNHTPLPSKQLSSTKDLQGIQVLDKSLSIHKKPRSRFSSPVERVVSPPVLKQVKNKALHEKYIDQLHSREAKRKSMSKCTKNCISGEKGLKVVHAAGTNDLRAAKNALISDAKDVIHQLQHLQANAMSNAPDFDDNGDLYDDVEGENEDEI